MPSIADFGARPRLGFTRSVLDRAAERRGDAAAIAALTAAPGAGVYVVCGEAIIAKKSLPTHNPLFALAQAHVLGEVRELVFLGLADGAARFGAGIDAAAAEALRARADLVVLDLRTIAVQGLVDPLHLPPLAQAKALLQWHARHRFCAACGAPTAMVEAGWRRDCPACRTPHFPRTDPVVIMHVVDGTRCLLGRQARFPPTMWSCLAGFVEPGENIEEAARRETREETGVVCGRVVYHSSQPWPFPMSLMIGCFAEALSKELTIDHSELDAARWFERAEVAQMMSGRHPDGLTIPPPISIAHHIIQKWFEDGDRVLR
ncbi:MAG: NAD(+) diphosphatase [Proteobacteria bacterium]|nr:NAD(+) diphosphatase [Pseudomonadota bacterium]